MFKITNKLAPVRNPIGLPFLELQSVDSTNNYATARVHEGMAHHGMAVFAHAQTQGKGQRHKQWVAASHQNILMSIVVEPRGLPVAQAFSFSMAMALAAYHFFSRYAGAETSIKWPNDLYWRDRKAGGLLIENILQGQEWRYAVVGMGININQTDFGALGRKAVSLKQITGKTHDPLVLAKALCGAVERSLQQLEASPETIREAYQQHLYKLNQTVQLKKEGRLFHAQIRGVTPQGQLVTGHGMETLFSVGEVEWTGTDAGAI